MSGLVDVNRRNLDILPRCIIPYLKRDGDTPFSTAEGYVKDLARYPAAKGLIGRVIFQMNNDVEGVL